MSYTYDGLRAEVEYRRDELLAGARRSRLRRHLRRRARSSQTGSGKVRDGTHATGYDLAA